MPPKRSPSPPAEPQPEPEPELKLEPLEQAEPERKPRQKKKMSTSTVFTILCVAVGIDVMCSVTADPLRPILLGEMVPGITTTGLSTTLARLTAMGALSEFAVNPLFGRLSDRFGRKPMIVGSVIFTALANALTFFTGNSSRAVALQLLTLERCL